MTGGSKFYSSHSPVRCGGSICLGSRWHLRQREIMFKGIQQLWVWMCEQSGSLAMLQLLKSPLSSDPLRNLLNAYLVMIWESFIQVTCLILLKYSVAEARVLQTFFPGWFSAALTASLSDFLLNSLHASHLLQQMEGELSGYSFHHLYSPLNKVLPACWSKVKTRTWQ